jgi:hypothetical protein
MFGLYLADVLKIKRTVEVYQWREEKVKTKDGDRYIYKKEWLSYAVNQGGFIFKNRQDGPANPKDDEWPCKSEEFINY